jgi:hypothetical protein
MKGRGGLCDEWVKEERKRMEEERVKGGLERGGIRAGDLAIKFGKTLQRWRRAL